MAALDFNCEVLATGYEDSRIGIWSLLSEVQQQQQQQHEMLPPPPPSLVMTLSGHNGGVTGLQINGQVLASGSYDGTVKLWNIHSGNCLRTFGEPENFVR